MVFSSALPINILFLRLLSGSRIASGALALAAALLASQARATAVLPVQDNSCWARMADRCLLKAPYRGITMSVEPNAGLIAFLGSQGLDQADLAITVDADVRSRVESGEYTLDEGSVILGELSGFDGAAYYLPPREELKSSLGFPPEMEIAEADYLELIRAHIQSSFSVSPVTANYLSNRLGVARVEEAETTVAHETLQSSVATSQQPADRPKGETILDPSTVGTPLNQ